MKCIHCEEEAVRVYDGNSVCQKHFEKILNEDGLGMDRIVELYP